MSIWRDKIIELEASGLSLDEIAAKASVTTAVLREIKAGRTKEPTGIRAVELHTLHAQHCKPEPRRARKVA